MREQEESNQEAIIRDPDENFGCIDSLEVGMHKDAIFTKESDIPIMKTDSPQRTIPEKEKNISTTSGCGLEFLKLKLPENSKVLLPNIEAKQRLNLIPSSFKDKILNQAEARTKEEEVVCAKKQSSAEVNKQSFNSMHDSSSKSFDFQAESWAMSTLDIQQKVESTIQTVSKTKEEFQDIMESFLFDKYTFVLATNK
jgi:hypothetical protein